MDRYNYIEYYEPEDWPWTAWYGDIVRDLEGGYRFAVRKAAPGFSIDPPEIKHDLNGEDMMVRAMRYFGDSVPVEVYDDDRT